MRSAVSNSVGGPRPSKWRLRTTLKRRVEYRPIENDDLRYAWAAYKAGKLKDMGGPLSLEGMSATEFKAAFESFVLTEFDAAWTMFAQTSKGFMPTGFIFCSWAPRSSYMIIVGVVWMPWASNRNIVESIVKFMQAAGKEYPMLGYALPEHKQLYEVCCMHGVMRRIGTSMIVFPSHSAAVFETRAKQ